MTTVAVIGSALLQTFVIQAFIRPAGLLSGGFTGIAILIDRVTSLFGINLSTSLAMVILNIPVAWACSKSISRRFTFFSLLQVFLASLFLKIFHFSPIFEDVILNVIYGGVLYGFCIVLALRGNASTGGTDFIAMSLSAKYKVSTFNYMLLFSAVIILISGTIFGMDKALYSIIFQFCNTQVINTFYKKYKKKTLLIVTDNPAAVSADLLELTNHSSTILKGFGSYSANKKYLIYTVLSDSDVRKMKKRIREQYPDTFVNVINSSDVVGNFYIQPLE